MCGFGRNAGNRRKKSRWRNGECGQSRCPREPCTALTWANARTDTRGILLVFPRNEEKPDFRFQENPALVIRRAAYFAMREVRELPTFSLITMIPCFFARGTARAHDRSRGVNLPAKLGHYFFEGRTFGPFEHLDQLGEAGRAGCSRCALRPSSRPSNRRRS